MVGMESSEMKGTQSKEFMDASIANRLDVLGKEISDIKTELESRTLLHNTLMNELEQGIKFRELEIKRFGGWNLGIFENRVNILEREIHDSQKEMRFEQLNYWRDISRLRDSLRRLLREYWQVQKRKEFMDKYLNKLNNIEW